MNIDENGTGLAFLRSEFSTENPWNSTADVLKKLSARKEQVAVKVNQIPLDSIHGWNISEDESRIEHESGKFFAIEGIDVRTNWGDKAQWDQPVINQPELGLLGIITREIDGVLYFLMQSKIEPGNRNFVQISPTLQATKSNYTQVHGGSKPLFLDYFMRDEGGFYLDQLQSEQGARFLRKRNRNIIVGVSDGELELGEDYFWLTLGQIKQLMRHDNVVNMDTRTVVSGISFGGYPTRTIELLKGLGVVDSFSPMLLSELCADQALFSMDEIVHWFSKLKASFELDIRPKSLGDLKEWFRDEFRYFHADGKFFEVIGVDVEIENRERTAWAQPMIKPVEEGICAFIVKEIDGVLHFLVQGKVESGNFDIVEMAPTVQCITGSYKDAESKVKVPYLSYVLEADEGNLLFDSYQSEEGGRFYQEQNRNLIVIADQDFPNETPDNYIWMTLFQIKTFIRFNNFLNIQARSLISAISYSEKS